MLDEDTTPTTDQPSTDQPSTDQPSTDQPSTDQPGPATTAAPVARTRRRAVSRPAGPPSAPAAPAVAEPPPAAPVDGAAEPVGDAAPTTPRKRTRKKAVAADPTTALFSAEETVAAPRKRAPRKKATAPTTESAEVAPAAEAGTQADAAPAEGDAPTATVFAAPVFQAPEPVERPTRSRTRRSRVEPTEQPELDKVDDNQAPATDDSTPLEDSSSNPADDADETDEGDDEDSPTRRRRRRGGRRRRKSTLDEEGLEPLPGTSAGADQPDAESAESAQADDAADTEAGEDGESGTTRRRRRRRRRGEEADGSTDDPVNTVVRVRERRSAEDEITSVSGSTRLEAKKQRRREGREAGRRRAPIVSEAEFLARREAVKREMVIRQKHDLTQIAVIEDDVLVEHYVARESQTSLIGNVYLGRVQNVLPSMEAAFVDIGKGRNAVLYAGEVDWKTLGNGKQRKIEDVLKSGQTVLVQVTKDPIGHKGSRLTSQISLAGRFLVYVPGGQTSGISRKLPDTERNRLKSLLKDVLPEEAGVIIRTAAEGATEEQLTRDVTALTARWDDIERKAKAGNAPQLLYGEPDLTIKVVRDLFNEDFAKLVVEGDDAWDMIEAYVQHVAPDLADRLERWPADAPQNAYAAYRVDEQIAKGLDRKVWLPSGGSLVIDRTEAMTVVDVNTGKFTGSGGNLEETVTKNNLEAAEEIVRQLRLRDIGGIIVVDFIDMVLESNRDLVMRRLVECLGRDRTRHQVAEVTSLGLVQMTRKRIGTGLLEAFSETCEHCQGRGLLVHTEPVDTTPGDAGPARGGRRRTAKGASRSAEESPQPAVEEQVDAVLTAEGQAP